MSGNEKEKECLNSVISYESLAGNVAIEVAKLRCGRELFCFVTMDQLTRSSEPRCVFIILVGAANDASGSRQGEHRDPPGDRALRLVNVRVW
jgi:hypothetical protein